MLKFEITLQQFLCQTYLLDKSVLLKCTDTKCHILLFIFPVFNVFMLSNVFFVDLLIYLHD